MYAMIGVDMNLINKLVQFQRDLNEHLPQEYIDEKMTEFSEMAKAEGVQLILTHRNPLVRNDLELQEEFKRLGSDIKSGVGISVIDK